MLAKMRKPSDKDRKPTEMISIRIDGTSKKIETTSIENSICELIEFPLTLKTSANLKIATENRIVLRISVINVAVEAVNESAKAKHKKLTTSKNKFVSTSCKNVEKPNKLKLQEI